MSRARNFNPAVTISSARVPIFCTGNSARSQMGEDLLRHEGADQFEVFSSGTEPSRVKPLAIRAMREAGIDISLHRSNSVAWCAGQEFDYVISFCGRAKDSCPHFPGRVERIHWSFEDPAAATGEKQARLSVFRRVRDESKRAPEGLRPGRKRRRLRAFIEIGQFEISTKF